MENEPAVFLIAQPLLYAGTWRSERHADRSPADRSMVASLQIAPAPGTLRLTRRGLCVQDLFFAAAQLADANALV